MNPHYLFASLALVSFVFASAGLAVAGDYDELQGMVTVVGIASAVIGAILAVTRKYWRNARRVS